MLETLGAESPLSSLRGVGPARERALAAEGCATLRDLLHRLPQRYEDRRQTSTLDESLSRLEALDGGRRALSVTIEGRLARLRRVRTRRRGLTLIQGRLEDGTGSVPVIWFNRPYLLQQVQEDETYVLHGELRSDERGTRLVNPSCEPAGEARDAGRIVPIYSSLGPYGPAAVRRLLGGLLDRFDPERGVADALPEELLARHRLPTLGRALKQLHRPPPDSDVERLNERRSAAHRRLIYGELFAQQLELAAVRSVVRRASKRHRYRIDDDVREIARAILPFRLTPAQKRVVREIVEDLRSPQPMLRLLQGDVGCGKTIVAALALVIAMESGLQAAFMAPTELLAEQHFDTFQRLLGERYRLLLVTGSRPTGSRPTGSRRMGRAKVQLAVGTHALIQERVRFERLGLTIVDEQHRFGVAQRQVLLEKGERPDMLVMTATPIPRSLALTAYGDLDMSVIDELPPGRSPVATEVLPEESRDAAYATLRAELDRGAQAYVVVPLIEESRSVEAASIDVLARDVRARAAPYPTAVLHGRLEREERRSVMRDFARGTLRVLLATTVVEVGVDVPAATFMLIESAQRFGLAQLHQLRGRVGRSERASRCIALHAASTPEAQRRLEVFASTGDGFRLAEADLEIRGPGDLLGTRQAGVPRLRLANPLRDHEILLAARQDAAEMLAGLSPTRLAELTDGGHPLAGG